MLRIRQQHTVLYIILSQLKTQTTQVYNLRLKSLVVRHECLSSTAWQRTQETLGQFPFQGHHVSPQ